MNYSLVKREEEDGSRYFSLLFNNYMTKVNKEKLRIENKAQIYNFKKDKRNPFIINIFSFSIPISFKYLIVFK